MGRRAARRSALRAGHLRGRQAAHGRRRALDHARRERLEGRGGQERHGARALRLHGAADRPPGGRLRPGARPDRRPRGAAPRASAPWPPAFADGSQYERGFDATMRGGGRGRTPHDLGPPADSRDRDEAATGSLRRAASTRLATGDEYPGSRSARERSMDFCPRPAGTSRAAWTRAADSGRHRRARHRCGRTVAMRGRRPSGIAGRRCSRQAAAGHRQGNERDPGTRAGRGLVR